MADLNNDLLDNSNLLDPNPDAIAEFRLLTSDYTAEYGRNGGGVISIVTKSGTNQIHGSLFEFLRNRDFDANDYFNKQQGLPRLDLKRNQYGATLGGPIVKDKAFSSSRIRGSDRLQSVPDIDSPVFSTARIATEIFPNSYHSTASARPTGWPSWHFLTANPYFAATTNGGAANAQIDPTKFDPVAQEYIKAGLIPSTANGLLSTTLSIAEDNRDELTTKFDFNLDAKGQVFRHHWCEPSGDPTRNSKSCPVRQRPWLSQPLHGQLLLREPGIHPDLFADPAQ